LDVPTPILKAVTGWIGRHRRRLGARPWQRAATVHAQVLLVLRWLRHRADLHNAARDTGISDATAYRYLHEGLEVIASHAPDLQDVLATEHAAGTVHLCLDGTLIPTDRVAARVEVDGEPRHNLWYSGKHHAFGGNVQVLADPTGWPLWTSDVRPGSTHDLTAARELVLPALYPPDHRPAGAGRTRPRPARLLASTRTGHRLSAANRHHRRRRPGPHLIAARPLVRKPQ
jgi:hypothetical protein